MTIPAYPSPHFRDIASLLFPDDKKLQPHHPLDGRVDVTTSDTIINLPTAGPETFCGISYTLTPRGKGSTGSMNIPGDPQERYFGAGYVDYPPVGQLEMTTDGRRLLVEGGMTYKALIVPDRTYISPEAEAKIRQLANDGLTVIRCDLGEDVADRLKKEGIAPDIELHSANRPDDKVLFFHRRMDDTDIYFVYNHSPRPFSQSVKLRGSQAAISFWDPSEAKRSHSGGKPASPQHDSGQYREVKLDLAPYRSTFIIASPAQ